MENLNLVLPEIFISLSVMFLLVLGVFKKDSSKIIFNLSLFAILITTTITINENIKTECVEYSFPTLAHTLVNHHSLNEKKRTKFVVL